MKFQGIMLLPLLIFHGKLLFRIIPITALMGAFVYNNLFKFKKRSL